MMISMSERDEQPDRGRPPDRVKSDGPWEDGLEKALAEREATEGWLDDPNTDEDGGGQEDD